LALPACSTYRDDLARSQRAFEDNQHEQALAILRMLERDTHQLGEDERARYAYIRGMTDFRIGYQADAYHWLAVAKAMDEAMPGELPSEWRQRLDQSLAELDKQVWSSGFNTLPIAPEGSGRHHTSKKHVAPAEERRREDTEEEEEEEQQPPKLTPEKKPAPADDDE
jgi:hypothetical protein